MLKIFFGGARFLSGSLKFDSTFPSRCLTGRTVTGTFTCESTYREASPASVSPNKEQYPRPLKPSGVVTRNVNRKAHRTSPEKSRSK